MKSKLEKIRTGLQKHRKELFFFWKYAIFTKLHFWKYDSRKVILFRLDLIGDCTMFTSAASAIREQYKDREVTVVCLSAAMPIFERLGIFDNIISVDFKPHEIDYSKLASLIAKLRKEKYDILLQPQLSKYPLADIMAAAIKCNRRISIETKVGNSREKWIHMVNFLYDEFIPYSRDAVSEFEYYGDFVRGIGNPDYKITRPRLPYKKQNFIEGNYYVMYPGGSLSQKFWPSERFAQLANYIYEQTGLLGVILGVSSEQWVSDRLKAHLKMVVSLNTVDLTGLTSITDVIDIIGNAQFVVSNDTSGVHIACATNTPSVANVGGWFFGRFLPYEIEDLKPEDNIPLVAYAKMPCYYCDWEWEKVGKRNEECLRRLKAGEPSECIYNIEYEQMRILVDQVMKKINLC
ncbi:glycosyltransferase family 9 protein [Fusibacter paucivorans]|uniref:Glycosyltransferase family 9 protein n=1 Tax=Fusibacter paucivorans TaxID=76009 RepID=A0ABS5PRB9_9FIRM|nr:glycosyltransferase family 9 protein [Fusibacter paucivorans]MBS7526607.1 glycosyltransferase family 9 protein [Fusibacter paucivorans]